MIRPILRTLCALVLLSGIARAATANAAGVDLARAYNDFGFKLFSQLAYENGDNNTFMSPTSIAVALAIATNGAARTTRESMLGLLGQPPYGPISAFDAANKTLLDELSNPGSDIQFSIANALWLSERIPPLPAFVKTSSDVFDATAQALPFGDPSATKAINDWVDKHTNGRIPEIIEGTYSNDLLYITNAIAMKAKWQDEFEKTATHDAPFDTASGGHLTVSMMARDGGYSYAQTADWQVARLPYRGDRFAMYVLLPRKGLVLHDALSTFDGTAFDKAIAGLHQQEIALAMPRYTATYKAELNGQLIHMGMGDAFDPATADFSNAIAPPKSAYVNKVIHRAFVRVDEEGTEAAAATAIGMRATAMRMPPETKMVVDRPFLMAIRDDKTKQVLFLGAIFTPEK